MSKNPTIKSTNDYSLFKTIQGNRTISPKKVERIIQDVKGGLDLFPYCPIIVTDKEGRLLIIDGQHRFEASKALEKPIFYVVANEIKLRDIARLNSATSNWSVNDFLKCYIALGNEHYKELQEFKSKYKLVVSVAASLLQSYKGNTSVMAAFKDGLFEVRHKEKAYHLMALVDDLFGHLEISRDKNLISAVLQLQEKGFKDVERLKEKIRKHHKMIDKQTTTKNYILLLEQVYNMGLHERVTIF